MFEKLKEQAPDGIMKLAGMYRADERANKIDLGVGVYKDASGATPIMRAIKNAERQLWDVETTKSYVALIGDGGFHTAMADLVLGDSVSRDRVSFAATPGGTGAIRQILELIKAATPDATIWMSNPTWPNHPAIINYVGLKSATYSYIDPVTRNVSFDNMMADLANVQSGDVVLLHGCCHNPTGANLTDAQWGEVADLIEAKGAMPFIDIAYQGFGDGLAEDSFGTRLLAKRFPEMLIAASCSKNFGVYRERTGIVMAISQNAKASKLTQGMLSALNRLNYSFPPDHGARLVTMVLTDDALRNDWKAELEDVRTGMLGLRKQLAETLRQETNSDRFDFVADHRGMFSRLGLTPEQVEKLRTEYAIYMIGDSRFNVAGLNAKTVPIIAKAIAEVDR